MKTQNEELKEILIKHNALNKTMEEVVEYGTELVSRFMLLLYE
jgi:hypothetical protein